MPFGDSKTFELQQEHAALGFGYRELCEYTF